MKTAKFFIFYLLLFFGMDSMHGQLKIGPSGGVGVNTLNNPKDAFQIGDRVVFHNGGTKYLAFNSYFNGGNDARVLYGNVSALKFTGLSWRFAFSGYGSANSTISWTESALIDAAGIHATYYYSLSDESSKTDIKDLGSQWEQLSKLEPKKYYFKSELEKDADNLNPLSFGFLAQDLMKVYPNLVTTTFDSIQGEDKYWVNYIGLIPILTSAVSELHRENEELKIELEKVSSGQSNETRLQELEQCIEGLCKAIDENSSAENYGKIAFTLGQSYPNPNHGSFTIEVNMLAGFEKAELLFYSADGKLVHKKEIKEKGFSKYEFNAENIVGTPDLYSLFVDGRLIDTKRILSLN